MKLGEIRQLDEWVGIDGRLDKYTIRPITELDGRITDKQTDV
jgi:hypothetical protein